MPVCSFGVIKWIKADLEDIERQTRTMMTNQRDHHSRSSVLRTPLSGKEGGRGITNIINLHTVQTKSLPEFFF